MTTKECITRLDSIKPNQDADSEKLMWLRILDDRIKRELFDTHELPDEVYYYGYDEHTDIETEQLLIPFPAYEDVYVNWLMAQVDYANMDIARYNNSMIMFNQLYSELCAYFNSIFMPKSTPLVY